MNTHAVSPSLRRGSLLTQDRVVFALLAIAILLPLFLNIGAGRRTPFVCTGDEPHYLVILSSVVEDFDLDLENNYRAVHAGGHQAGVLYKGSPLDHHTVVEVGDQHLPWTDLYNWSVSQPGVGEAIHVRVPGAPVPAPEAVERSNHPNGIAVLAPLVFFFRGTKLLESAALLLAAAATLGGAVAFRSLASRLTDLRGVANLAMCLAFLATPVWHFARTFFNEPFLLGLALGAYALHLKDRTFLASLLLAVGTQMKPPFLLLAIPLGVDLLVRGQWRSLGVAVIAPALSVLLVLFTHWWFFGDPLRPPQPFVVGNPLVGARGLLFDWKKGLLPLAPVMALALFGWVALLRRPSRTALLCGAGFLSYFGLMATWSLWDGAWSYGPRLIGPVIPLLALGLVPVLQRVWNRGRWMAGIAALALISTAINGAAAFEPCRYIYQNPADRLLARLGLNG